MNRFAYICGDPGIPVPGTKGASIHVASVCRALVQQGLDGTVYSCRPEQPSLHGLPVVPFDVEAARPRETVEPATASAFPANGPCDFVYERYSLWHVGGLAEARRRGVPFVVEVNSPLPEEARRYRKLPHEDVAFGVARRVLGEADAVVVVSESVGDWVATQRGHSRGIWVIPNGVDAELFSPAAAEATGGEPRTPDHPTLAFCGSFRPWHAVEDLLEAFRVVVSDGFPGARLVCVGDGPIRDAFEERAKEYGLEDRVRMTGAVAHDEVPGILRDADVAVAPYPDLDGFYFSPLKIFEFMALGLPVVSADLGQIPALLGDGERGRLYGAGRIDEMAAAITALLKDPAGARRMGAAGRRWVLDHATWARRVRQILDGIEAL